MAYIDGDDFVDGAILSFQQGNRMKNAFRLATPPGNPSPGMTFSDSDDNKYSHWTGAAWWELLQIEKSQQAAIVDATGAGDIVVQFNDLLAKMRTIGLIAT